MSTPNYTKQDAIKSAKEGFSQLKEWVTGKMISEVAEELEISTQTVRNYCNGVGLDGACPRMHNIAAVLMLVRQKVAIVKNSFTQTPATA